ncbi:hypothetical protein C8R46DRAFT_255622 [Mycena filopes]|nr:hypothetical protein C8R46DRAFT_255622 [Mycena filopes]
MQRARRTGVSSFKGVEFVYSIATKVSEKMKWEPTKDSPLPNQAVFVLADRTAPRPHKNSRLKNEKTKSQEEEWDGIRYARLTIENSKVTITDLGYTTETGDRISVNSKSLVVAGRRYPLQDGDEVVFPRRARSSTEKVRSAEAQKVTVCVKFFFGLDKAKCRFMPEPSANDTGRTHLPLEAVASEPTENVPKGRPPTGIANDPLPTGVVASSTARTRAAEPSSSNSTLALFLPWNSGTRTPSTSNARPPLEPRTTTDDAVQRNPGTSSVDNTPDTPSSSTSTLFSRSSTGLSWSSSATTPAQSPRSSEHSRSPSPTARRGSGAKDTAQLSLGTSKTATDDAGRGRQPKRPTLRPGEKFTGASVLTPLKYRLMQSRSPSTVARSRSRTVNGDRPTSVLPRTRDGSLSRRPIPARLLSTPSPASTVNGRARTFGAKDQIARQL